MRFAVEREDGDNKGLTKAIDRLEGIYPKYSSQLSRADFYVLAGTVAIEASGGFAVSFATGRKDYTVEEAQKKNGTKSGCPFGDGKINPSGSRLPPADLGPDASAPMGCPVHQRESKTIDAIRATFDRLGFDDKETVCLIILGHQYGRGHPEISGFEGPWYAFDPAHWNVYSSGLGYLSLYSFAVERGQMQERVTNAGQRQWEMKFSHGMEPFMMMPVDMALFWDKEYYQHVQGYDRDRRAFARDAAKAWKKLIELGCPPLQEEKPRAARPR